MQPAARTRSASNSRPAAEQTEQPPAERRAGLPAVQVSIPPVRPGRAPTVPASSPRSAARLRTPTWAVLLELPVVNPSPEPAALMPRAVAGS